MRREKRQGSGSVYRSGGNPQPGRLYAAEDPPDDHPADDWGDPSPGGSSPGEPSRAESSRSGPSRAESSWSESSRGESSWSDPDAEVTQNWFQAATGPSAAAPDTHNGFRSEPTAGFEPGYGPATPTGPAAGRRTPPAWTDTDVTAQFSAIPRDPAYDTEPGHSNGAAPNLHPETPTWPDPDATAQFSAVRVDPEPSPRSPLPVLSTTPTARTEDPPAVAAAADEDHAELLTDEEPVPGQPGAVAAATLAWYLVPTVLVGIWLLIFGMTGDTTTRSPALRLIEHLHWIGLALVISLGLSQLLRLVMVGWRAYGIGFAATVIGGAATTALVSVLGHPVLS